ncbi:MAG: hypothetical protein IJK64_10830 [Clostridia bacterium]|nr:hypothetical protein [Clostridia bacterium]
MNVKGNQIAKAFFKVLLSGMLAFLILTLFCFFYYNVPVHCENNEGTTDYKWEPHVFFSRGTEGFAWGKTNNEGFTDLFAYSDDVDVDVLIMGSSHMEAFQVAMDESLAGQLNERMGDRTVYNIGISGHNFLTCCGNLEAALERYSPSYLIIETEDCLFSDEALTDAVNGTTAEIPSHAGGILGLLQKNQYLRLLYAQFMNFKGEQVGDADFATPAAQAPETVEESNNGELLSALLQKISGIAREHNAALIIMYHPGIAIDFDGTMRITGSSLASDQLGALCRENGIHYLDMRDRFLSEYEKDHTLPYGFVNTSVGTGHLNKRGHAMIADELYKLITEVA